MYYIYIYLSMNICIIYVYCIYIYIYTVIHICISLSLSPARCHYNAARLRAVWLRQIHTRPVDETQETLHLCPPFCLYAWLPSSRGFASSIANCQPTANIPREYINQRPRQGIQRHVLQVPINMLVGGFCITTLASCKHYHTHTETITNTTSRRPL